MWQPIETAPKDGSFILLATPKGRIADGFWSPVYGVWSWPYVMVEPTHWMPLPGRPGAQAQPEPSVPDGWQLVPMEPTIHMCIQGDNSRANIDDCTRTPAIYRAMLAAAPKPEGES